MKRATQKESFMISLGNNYSKIRGVNSLALLMLMLGSCGKEDPKPTGEDLSTVVSTPAVVPTPVTVVPTPVATATQGIQISKTSPTPEPTAVPTVVPSEFQSLHAVVQQPFETGKWKFDLTNPTTLYPEGSPNDMRYMKNVVSVYRKETDQWGVTTTSTCTFRVKVSIPPSATVDSWGVLTLQAGVSVGIGAVGQPAVCQATQLQYIYFKISNKCQGYSQDTYKCGIGGAVKYELVEL